MNAAQGFFVCRKNFSACSSLKNYDAELLARGIPKEKIRHYGFAFEGKNVLIGS